MVIDKKNSIASNIYAEGEKLEQVKKYKYLGSWITENGKCLEEVKNRIGQAKTEFWNCKEFLRSNLNLKLMAVCLNKMCDKTHCVTTNFNHISKDISLQ